MWKRCAAATCRETIRALGYFPLSRFSGSACCTTSSGSTQGNARSAAQPASDLAPDELYRRTFASHDVRLHHVHRVGCDLRHSRTALNTGSSPHDLACGLHFWLAFLGVTIYVGALSIAGTVQGLTWASGDPFIASVAAAQPYWEARAVSGTMMFLAHVVFAYNVWKMTLARDRHAGDAVGAARSVTADNARGGMNDVRILVLSAAAAYGVLAVVMGVIPGIVMSATRPGPGVVPYSAAAQRGREVYISEGCTSCHLQRRVRPLAQDQTFGRTSTAGDRARPRRSCSVRSATVPISPTSVRASRVTCGKETLPPRTMPRALKSPDFDHARVHVALHAQGSPRAAPATSLSISTPEIWAGREESWSRRRRRAIWSHTSNRVKQAPLAGGALAVNGVQMTPPPEVAIRSMSRSSSSVALLATAWTIVLAVRASCTPGEADPAHPKYQILEDDR